MPWKLFQVVFDFRGYRATNLQELLCAHAGYKVLLSAKFFKNSSTILTVRLAFRTELQISPAEYFMMAPTNPVICIYGYTVLRIMKNAVKEKGTVCLRQGKQIIPDSDNSVLKVIS